MRSNSSLERKARLLRVGVDTTGPDAYPKFRDKYPNGGFLGPFWNEGEDFEFVPIPENKMVEKSKDKYYPKCYLEGREDELVYGKLPGVRLNKRMIQTIQEIDSDRASTLKNIAVHWDPDFEHKTYGDARGKGIQNLNKNDLLVFCASLQNPEKKEDHGLFIIGYFTLKERPFYLVRKEFDVHKRRTIIQQYNEKNAHFSKAWARAWNYGEPNARKRLLQDYETKEWENFVLAVGNRENGGLLSKAIRITDPKPKWIPERGIHSSYCIMPEIAKSLGIDKKQRVWERGTRKVEGERHVGNLLKRLDEGLPFHPVVAPRA